jgi:hypoxanthine phosphoribosyltransferase
MITEHRYDIPQLFSADDIKNRIREISSEIKNEYKTNDELVIICLLKGGFTFTADLIRELWPLDARVDFMSVSSYGNELKSSGVINIKQDISTDISGKNIIIIDDIVDTGRTLFEIRNYLSKKNPNSIKTCCLLDKKEKREFDIDIDYYGFVCPDVFVVGYGMDASGMYRNLPYIGQV